MKSFLNAGDRDAIVRRFRMVKAESARRWGKMTAHQMVCHVNDAYLAYMNERPVPMMKGWVLRPVILFVAVWTPLPWPRGAKTMPEVDQMVGGTKPVEFARDVEELERVIGRFCSLGADYAWPAHPVFGQMSHASWMRLGYLHADHHLRQFGA